MFLSGHGVTCELNSLNRNVIMQVLFPAAFIADDNFSSSSKLIHEGEGKLAHSTTKHNLYLPPYFYYFSITTATASTSTSTTSTIFIPGLLKTGLAKISTHSTTWQFKTIKLVQRPIKSLYLTPGSKLMIPRSIPTSPNLK